MLPFIIINNAAARARAAWPIVQAKLQQTGLAYEVHYTARAGDATIVTRRALDSGDRVIAVLGGDGTLSEVAQGFFEVLDNTLTPNSVGAVLAVLPAGTGDDFARGLADGRASLEAWTRLLIAYCAGMEIAQTRMVDVLVGANSEFPQGFICLNASTMGIGGETAARVAAQGDVVRLFSGETRFMIAAVVALMQWRERTVRVTVDEQLAIEGPMNLVAVANNRYAGGGMLLSPTADIADGELDVVTASGLTRGEVMRELPRIHSGGHVSNPKVKIFRGKSTLIETFSDEDGMLIEADGNLRGKTPVRFFVLPKALRVLTF